MIRLFNDCATGSKAHAATLAGWFQQVCTIGGAIVTIPVVLRSLGSTEAGIWFSLQGIIAVFSLSDFGFSMAISRQVAHSFKLNGAVGAPVSDLIDVGSGWDGVRILYEASRSIFWRVAASSILLFIVAYQMVIPWTNLLQNRTLQTALVWYLLAGAFAAAFLTRLSQSFLDGLGYMYIGRGIAGLYQVYCTVIAIIVLRLNWGLVGLAAVVLTGSILQFLAMHFSLKSVSSGKLTTNQRGSRSLIGKLWKVSLPFGLVNTGVYLVGAVQVPLLGALLGPLAVAPMYIAFRISQALNSTVSQIVTAQLPFFTQQCAQGHWSTARLRMRNTLIVGIALQSGLALFILFASRRVVFWWVGAGNYIDGKVLLVFAINYAVTSLAALPAQFVLASGRNPFAVSTLIHGILTLCGMAILCPLLGLLGAPLASLIAVMLTNFWQSPLEGWRTWHSLSRLAKVTAHPQGQPI